MMHKAWSNIGEVPYCFWRSPIKFQGHTGQKIVDFDSNWAFPDWNSSLNSLMALKWCTKLDMVLKRCSVCFPRSSIKFQGHTGQKIVDFDSNWAFPDWNSSLNSLMALKWCTKLDMVLKRCSVCFPRSSIKFQGHVRETKKSLILTWIERFRTVTPVWIDRWLWNDAQSLKWYKRGTLLFFKVIHQISRSHRAKNRFWPKLGVSGL